MPHFITEVTTFQCWTFLNYRLAHAQESKDVSSGQGSYTKSGSTDAVSSFYWSPEEMPPFPSQHISIIHHKRRQKGKQRWQQLKSYPLKKQTVFFLSFLPMPGEQCITTPVQASPVQQRTVTESFPSLAINSFPMASRPNPSLV